LRSLVAFAKDIKLTHSVFALPFAAAAFLVGGLPAPTAAQGALLVVCMVAARSFAMGMNRYLDRQLDAENPRTARRMIPAGELTAGAALAISLAAAGLFVAAAFRLSPLAGACAVPLLLILVTYSTFKRWSWLTHWYLGLCLGLAPIAVQVALTGTATLPVLLLGAAVLFWTAGFDILYALQDIDFDRQRGLFSIPGRFGPAAALWLSRLSFAAMIALLAVAGVLSQRAALYYVGIAVVAAILAYEHWLVRDARATGKSANINAAFFNANAAVSLVFLLFALLDAVLG
jgi:4-hydroxybenzoate polyprenyltransferase